jgi:hypothetical protein
MKIGSSISQEDIRNHYTSFSKLFNNIQICDPTTSEDQYVQLYKDSLPLSLIQLMDGLDSMKTLDVIHNATVSACNIMLNHASGLNRDRKHVLSTTVTHQRQEDVYENEYDDNDDVYQDEYNVYDEPGFDAHYYAQLALPSKMHHVHAMPHKSSKPSSTSRHSSSSTKHPSSSSRHSSSSSSSHASRRPIHKQRERSRSASLSPASFYKSLLCWHCGGRGHGVGQCPIARSNQPQTPEGQKVYAAYCASKGETRVYDVKAMLQKYMNKRRIFNRDRSGSSVERSGSSDNEVTVISDSERSGASSRESSPYPTSTSSTTKTNKYFNTMKIVCSMKLIKERKQVSSPL